MRMQTALLITAMVYIANCAIQAGSPCGRFEIYTEERGCIKSCKDPSFQKCLDVFPALWDPKFCALLKDGTWQSYTYQCQACKNTNAIGVDDGICDDNQKPVKFCKKDSECAEPEICLTGICFNRCKTTKCPGGSICVHGDCIPQIGHCSTSADCKKDEKCVNGKCRNKCWNVICLPEETCVNGVCQKPHNSLDVCPVDANYNIVHCKPPRPDEKTCPKVFYVRKPDPIVCGITASGERIDYPRECQACKNKDIVYYFDQPCHKAPFVCEKKQKCLNYYCQSACKSSQECPFDWQTCFENRCIDKCALWKCASCKYGQCLYQEPVGKCTNDSECSKDTWSCVGFECVDLCQKQACGYKETCKKGACYPN